MTDDPTNVADQVPSAPDIERLHRPADGPLEGHEICADIHTSLSVAEAVVRSRRQRVAEQATAESTESLLRELRALGIVEAAPQLVAMVAIVDTAVDRLADAGAMAESEAWEQLRKDVVRKHCHSPDTWPESRVPFGG